MSFWLYLPTCVRHVYSYYHFHFDVTDINNVISNLTRISGILSYQLIKGRAYVHVVLAQANIEDINSVQKKKKTAHTYYYRKIFKKIITYPPKTI